MPPFLLQNDPLFPPISLLAPERVRDGIGMWAANIERATAAILGERDDCFTARIVAHHSDPEDSNVIDVSFDRGAKPSSSSPNHHPKHVFPVVGHVQKPVLTLGLVPDGRHER